MSVLCIVVEIFYFILIIIEFEGLNHFKHIYSILQTSRIIIFIIIEFSMHKGVKYNNKIG